MQGTVIEVIYENEETGFKICDIDVDGSLVTIKGSLPFLYPGEVINVEGHVTSHPLYGEQFIVESYTKELPRSLDDMEAFLASGLIEGVGNVTAHAIVSEFKEDTFNVLLYEPERIEKIKGISHNKALKIAEAFSVHMITHDVIVFFRKYGLSTNLDMKIYNIYGSSAIEKIKENPFQLIDRLDEISFIKADAIAKSMGYAGNSNIRIAYGILHVLKAAMSSGHVYLPRNLLINKSIELLNVTEDEILSALEFLRDTFRITAVEKDEDFDIYIFYVYQCEEYIANKLYEISSGQYEVDETLLKKTVDDFANLTGYYPDELQINSIKQAASSGFSVITGGPGTGKTTVIMALLRLLRASGKKCLLAAPTGRAAKRMSEACDSNAKTIHRLLEFTGGEDQKMYFGRNESNLLECDVLIIDESSMMDIFLTYHLLRALPRTVQLIFVGDKDQLPSVGPGRILRDIINTGKFNICFLENIYRRDQNSIINTNAYKINSGQMPEFNIKERDFFIVGAQSPIQCKDIVKDLCEKRLVMTYNIDPIKDIQVLIPTKKGTCGTIDINRMLQNSLNPPSDNKDEITFQNTIFRQGDRVMQIKNDYELNWHHKDKIGVEGKGVFNGEMGSVEAIDSVNKKITVLFDDDKEVIYDLPSLISLEHCYAITIHKSQGSEFDYCVIPLFSTSDFLLTRNILYTAITRAKKMVVIVGNPYVVRKMIDNNTEQKRYTGLTDKIIEIMEGK